MIKNFLSASTNLKSYSPYFSGLLIRKTSQIYLRWEVAQFFVPFLAISRNSKLLQKNTNNRLFMKKLDIFAQTYGLGQYPQYVWN